jgi:hypothetical protein
MDRPRFSRSRGARKGDATFLEIILGHHGRNRASATALAFVTYSLVPYLGILFCPGAVLMGIIGWFTSYRNPERAGRGAARASIFFGLFILGGQIFLWWLLYKIPAWAAVNPGRATGPPF